MEHKTEKRGPGRPKKYEKSKVFSLRLAGEELRILDYILKQGGKKGIHEVVVDSLEKYKRTLERQEVKNLFRNHIQKSIKRNKRLESSVFNGYALDKFSVDLYAIYFAERQEGEHITTFLRRNSKKLVQMFPEKIMISVEGDNLEEVLNETINVLFPILQWQENEDGEKAFIEKVLKAEWYFCDSKDAFVLSAEYIEEQTRSNQEDEDEDQKYSTPAEFLNKQIRSLKNADM